MSRPSDSLALATARYRAWNDAVARKHETEKKIMAAAHITKIDLAGLRVALTVLRKHEELLRGSAVDLGGEEFGPSIARTCMAIDHVLSDGYRDRGTRSSS